MYEHILVPTDGSDLSEKAVTHAIELARKLGARLTAFYASPEYPTPIVAEGIVCTPKKFPRISAGTHASSSNPGSSQPVGSRRAS